MYRCYFRCIAFELQIVLQTLIFICFYWSFSQSNNTLNKFVEHLDTAFNAMT